MQAFSVHVEKTIYYLYICDVLVVVLAFEVPFVFVTHEQVPERCDCSDIVVENSRVLVVSFGCESLECIH